MQIELKDIQVGSLFKKKGSDDIFLLVRYEDKRDRNSFYVINVSKYRIESNDLKSDEIWDIEIIKQL